MLMIVASLMLSTTAAHGQAVSEMMAELSNPEWNTMMDTGGYSDVLIWEYNSQHQYGPHEMTSGEWAAAIYYPGIVNGGGDPTAGAGTATWLTDKFTYPDFNTNSAFTVDTGLTTWDNLSNPVVGSDTGTSTISNGQVSIRIDYEMADLTQSGATPLGTAGGPGSVSCRYVLLQTYTITNLSDTETIEDVEFYQMLHAHPADEHNAQTNSVYDSTLYAGDALASYTPYDSVHSVGEFRYDITQWNVVPEQGEFPEPGLHADFISFSSTVPPDSYDNNEFSSDGPNLHTGGKPDAPGTHWDIEGNNLNNIASAYGEVAGAEAWFLGDLDPEASVSHTVALMLATPEPGTMAMLAIGGLAVLKRRRRGR